jgi:hypothetical protein
MQGIASPIMKKLIVALKRVDEINEGMVLLSMMQRMIPPDDFDLLSRFFTFPGQDVVMTDANCIKLKLFMAIGIMNRVFTARFHIILRGGFAVRMNILKTMQTVGSFATTKDMDDLISTVSNADLDCLVVPEIGVELSMEDQSEIIKLLQTSIANTAETFVKIHMESDKARLSKMDEFRKKELEATQKKIEQHNLWISGISDEAPEEDQVRKKGLNDRLQKLQEIMKVSAVAKPDEFGLTIRPATNSVLTTKINWKTSGSQTELMDVTVMPAHDASSLYANTSHMKIISTTNAVWYYPGQDTLFIEYLNVMHEVTQNIQQLSSNPVLSTEYRESQLIFQLKKMDKFKSRVKICYELLDHTERGKLIRSMPPHLLVEFEIASASKKGGAKSRRSKHKPRVRRTKKRNSRKIRK